MNIKIKQLDHDKSFCLRLIEKSSYELLNEENYINRIALVKLIEKHLEHLK